MPAQSLTDVHIMTVAVVMMVVLHAVRTGILTTVYPNIPDWLQAIASFIEDNQVCLQEKANTITAQVAVIVGEMKHRNIIPPLNLLHLPWKFSEMEAKIFATELSQSIEANLM
ncbi:hypothetical protein B0H19DRAFT_1273766 [Mycena capillaripes]|nr:hypothetical protein B0H19DRAFT_1273766 [Mycena capillaripes]